MPSALKQLASKLFSTPAEQDKEQAGLDDVQLAAAVLMVEVARADFSEDAVERRAVEAELRSAFGLDEGQVARLMQAASRRADEAVSLHRFVATINDSLSYADKLDVLTQLWRVAYADGELDKHEEHLMRRFSDMLHIPHRDWIQRKLSVAPE
ncbi:MAG: TerB family tellurite resistance protein [Abyssibacter sp.]|uniref:tellurite resistance TerB family protein n=1 Tax=Abyssibacter sp. TaxID=2320200 RepID=UPI002EBB9291|nr:TerB family tellurite resistance protein [Pseudomonadota bacterium]